MFQALFEELKEIMKSDDDSKTKLLKIDTLVGLADKMNRQSIPPTPPTPHVPQPTHPAQPAPQPTPQEPVIRSEGAIVDMTPPIKTSPNVKKKK